MLKQGRKREAKGLAVLYFIIGLIILLIILAVIYFVLAKLDYSDKIDPETTVRPYVEATEEPKPFVENEDQQASDAVPEYVMPEDEVDLTTGLEELPVEDQMPAVEEPAAEQPAEQPAEQSAEAPVEEQPAEAPVEEQPAEAPVEEQPAEEAAPEATPLPADAAAKPIKDIPKLPDSASENGAIGITGCYVSQPDDNKLMALTGFGYVNEDSFDGAQARSWLVVTQVASGQKIAYELTLKQGASGLPHSSAVCQNPTDSDFEIVLDVSPYQEGIYSLALVIGYKQPNAKNATFKYYPFSGDVSFTVLDGRIVTPVTASAFE